MSHNNCYEINIIHSFIHSFAEYYTVHVTGVIIGEFVRSALLLALTFSSLWTMASGRLLNDY